MARKRTSKKSKRNKADSKDRLAPGVGKEVFAIILVAVAILLTVGFFNAGGTLTENLLEALRLIIGLAAYVLPAILLFLAWRLFKSKQDDISKGSYIGLLVIILALAGLFHIGIEPSNSLNTAEAGNGGGLVGFAISKGLLALLNVFTASIVLLALGLIGLVVSLNIRLSQLIGDWLERRRERKADGLEESNFKSKESDGKMTINTQVPVESGQNIEEAQPTEPEVLTAALDPEWRLPPLDLLEDKPGKADAGKPEENAEIIKQTLASFGIECKMEEVNIGPTVTQYTLKPASDVRLSKISELTNNLELALAAHPIRIEAPIPGKSAVGIEVPNRKVAIVRLRQILETDDWQNHKAALTFAIGRDIAGQSALANLSEMPHLLIAGATGAGKSITINGMLLSLLYHNSPANLKLILVDPKLVELKAYDGIPHLLSPVITEPDKCISALKWATQEMERRYRLFSEQGKRNISEYNSAVIEEAMPFVVIVIDELAELMATAMQDVESLIVRLAQKARATGIHLVLATQRPEVKVITGLIKANVPARIALSTRSQVDSRTIIDQSGAEKLLGKGDMLYLAPGLMKVRRLQGVFVSEKELGSVTDYLRQAREPNYNDDVLNQDVKLGGKSAIGDMDVVDDSLFMDAAQLVIESGKASASLLQRRLRVGYARAARLLDMLEERGIVAPPDGARPREVLADSISEVMGDDGEPEA